jgi:hypothetical protein
MRTPITLSFLCVFTSFWLARPAVGRQPSSPTATPPGNASTIRDGEKTPASDRDRSRPIRVIYGTDLLHPHDDPDDHFDLATLFAMPELDVRAILLDLGDRQQARPGRVPVDQMLAITGRKVPYATGLEKPLKSPNDKGLDQPAGCQGNVNLLLRALRESPEPVIVFTAGSVRDLCAAFNREPALLKSRIARAYINIGTLNANEDEWNVTLDRQACIGVMRSGLPIYWCPCLPIGKNRSTHWVFKQHEVLEGVPAPLLNYFIYALQQVRPDEIDPLAALSMDLRPWRHLLMGMDRNMWCTGPLIHAAGRRIYREKDRWIAAASPENATPADVFAFIPARIEIDEKGHTKWTENAADANMHMYKVTDPANHQPALKSCLRNLLEAFPTSGRPGQGLHGGRPQR